MGFQFYLKCPKHTDLLDTFLGYPFSFESFCGENKLLTKMKCEEATFLLLVFSKYMKFVRPVWKFSKKSNK